MNKVKGFRIMLGMTQEEMAAAIGISINTYRTWEDDPGKFKLEQAQKFTKVVNKVDPTITLADIFSN